MICKFCGMESATTERCSFCGQPLAAAGEASPPPALETEAAVTPPASEPAAIVDLPDQAAETAPAIAPQPALPKSSGPRKPAPGILPQASERVRRGPETIQPIAQWVPWERAPQADAARPMNLTGESAAQGETERPHISLSDPLAEHTLYMQNAPQSRPAPLLNAEAGGTVPDVTPPPVTASPVPAVGGVSAATSSAATSPGTVTTETAKPVAPKPATRPVQSDKNRDKNKDIRPDYREPILPTDALGRYAGAFALVLIVAAALAFVGPNFSAVPLVIAQFVGALLLPVLRLVPWQDEDADDVIFFILLTLMFGPVVSLVVYGVLGIVRQTANPAIVGCMVVAALTRLVVDFAARTYPPAQVLSQTMPFTHLAQIDSNLVKILLKDWSGMLALAGWYTANIFHKFDE